MAFQSSSYVRAEAFRNEEDQERPQWGVLPEQQPWADDPKNCQSCRIAHHNSIYSVLRLIGSVSCGFEEIEAFFVSEEVADVTYGVPEFVVGSRRCLSDQRLEF